MPDFIRTCGARTGIQLSAASEAQPLNNCLPWACASG